MARDDDDCVELDISALTLDTENNMKFSEESAPHEWSFEAPHCAPPDPAHLRPGSDWHNGRRYPSNRETLYELDWYNRDDYRQVCFNIVTMITHHLASLVRILH